MIRKFVIIAALVASFAGSLAAQDEEKTKSPWSGSVDFGGNYLSGNSDLTSLYGGFKSKRCLDESEFILGIDGAYGQSNGIRNKQWVHGSTQYNYNFSHPYYGGLFADVWHDDIANLRYRATVSPLGGVYLIKSDCTTLSVEAGPAYTFEEQRGITDGYAALRFAQRFEHCLNPRSKIWQSLEYRPEFEDFSNYLLIGEAGLQTWISNRVSTKLFVQNRYDSEPGSGQEENDMGVYLALAYGKAKPPGTAESKAKLEKKSPWKFTGTIGASSLSGNTESSVYNAAIEAVRCADCSETGLGINGSYGDVANNVTAQQLGAYAFQNFDFKSCWYAGLRTDVDHDEIARLDYRVSSGGHAGYRFIDCKATSLKVEAGPGYVWERQNGDREYASLRSGEYFEHCLTPTVKLTQSSEYLTSVEDFEDWLWVNKAGIDISLFCNWAWSNNLVHTYDNTPANGLKESDLSVMSGLKWSF